MRQMIWAALAGVGLLVGCGPGSHSDYTAETPKGTEHPTGDRILQPGVGQRSDGLAVPGAAGTGGSGQAGQGSGSIQGTGSSQSSTSAQGSAQRSGSGASKTQRHATGQKSAGGSGGSRAR